MKRVLVFMVSLLLVTGAAAQAADYPVKPIRILSMGTPGSVVDAAARRLADLLAEELGTTVTVSAHPGSSGNIAINMLLSSRTDGYTLACTIAAPFGENIHGMDVRYSFADLTPITMLGISRMGIVSGANAPWNTIEEAFRHARDNGRPLRAAVLGVRSREVLEFVAAQEDSQLVVFTQQGGTSTLAAVLEGHVDVGIAGSIIVENAKAGKVKPLATIGDERMCQLPAVPTLKEQGYDIFADSPLVLSVSSKVSPEIVHRLSEAVEKISRTESFQKGILEDLSCDPMPIGRAAAEEYLKDYHNLYAREKGAPELP